MPACAGPQPGQARYIDDSMTPRYALPLVYSCSGCSSAAQLANHLALRLDRAGLAEMSCIAGVGGNVPALVHKARQAHAAGRTILALDGCALACTRACLAERGMAATLHVQLQDHGVRKHHGTDFEPAQADALYAQLADTLASGTDAAAGSSTSHAQSCVRAGQGAAAA